MQVSVFKQKELDNVLKNGKVEEIFVHGFQANMSNKDFGDLKLRCVGMLSGGVFSHVSGVRIEASLVARSFFSISFCSDFEFEAGGGGYSEIQIIGSQNVKINVKDSAVVRIWTDSNNINDIILNVEDNGIVISEQHLNTNNIALTGQALFVAKKDNGKLEILTSDTSDAETINQ